MLTLQLTAIAFLFGALCGRKFFQRVFVTTQEQLDALAAIATPAQVEALIALSVARLIVVYKNDRDGQVTGYQLYFKDENVVVKSPERAHIGLLLQDVETFQRQVEAFQAAKQAAAL